MTNRHTDTTGPRGTRTGPHSPKKGREVAHTLEDEDMVRQAMYAADTGNFLGHSDRECGEHRTVGTHRAWCHDCSTWCYPGAPCGGCELPVLRDKIHWFRAQRDKHAALAERAHAQLDHLGEYLAEHHPTEWHSDNDDGTIVGCALTVLKRLREQVDNATEKATGGAE